MFDKFFNKMYYGNANKPDLKKEDIASESRLRLFFIVLSVRFWDLVKLNLIYILACIPLITIGPATAGFTYVLRNYARDEHAWLWEDFKTIALKFFKKSLTIVFLNTLAVFIMGVAVWFYYHQLATSQSMIYYMAFFFVLGVIMVFIMMNLYIFPLLISYNLTIKDIYKYSFIFTIGKLPYNLVIVLFYGLIIYISIINVFTLVMGFLFTLSFMGLIINSFTNGIFDRYMNQKQ